MLKTLISFISRGELYKGFSNIHLDFDYTPGMNAHCNEPLWCRPINGPAPTPEDAAGKYGDYNCDLPTIVAEMMFDYIQAMPEKPDLVFWTGDNIAHDIWNQTAHKNADYTIKITDWMIEHWPEIPVFAVPGNHEFFPVNVMKFSEQDSLLNLVSEVWKHWLDDKSYHSFKTYGYYTMPLKGLNEDWKGFRVIGINTEACNAQNWYLFTQLNDPGNHLAWLEKTLKETEEAGERAYIIGHVQPGGGSCLNEWSVRYRSLIERYQHVVIAHFFGHSHSEFFNVFTDTKNSSSIGVMHGPGGVTTYTDDNPAFRVYDIDYETGYPVKAYKYFFNITKANLGNPEWEYAYELTEEYKLANMSPEAFKNLTLRFLSEDGIATKYLQNSESRSPHGMRIDCSSMGCRHSLYCSTNNIITFERRDCNGQKRIDFKNSLEDALYETFFDPWIEKSE